MNIHLDIKPEKFNKAAGSEVLVLFKVFHERTPNGFLRKLIHRNNILPIRDLGTRIVVTDNEDGLISMKETLIYYIFSGVHPRKIEMDGILYVYRKGLDPEFEEIEYLNSYEMGTKEVKKLSYHHSLRMTQIIDQFFNSSY